MTLPGQVVLPGDGVFLPRMIGPAASSRAWNLVDEQRALLGASLRVARTTAWESVQVAHTPNVDLIVPWEIGTQTGAIAKWSRGAIAAVTILEPGSYLVIFQMRFAATGPYGLGGTTSGWRKCRILCNGTSAPQHTLASSPPVPGSASGNGVTCQAVAVATLRAGDVLYGGFRHSSTPPLTMANPTGGGTFLSITYQGPGVRT